jgi:dihydropteroate synthase
MKDEGENLHPFSFALHRCLRLNHSMNWQIGRRIVSLEKPLVMAILNVTPDSFSDGGKFYSIDNALRQTEKYIEEGADIIDIGGESTRPNSVQISAQEEINRTAPIIKAICKRFDMPVSIDTSKSEVARKAIESGTEIINDVSGLRFDEKIAEVAFQTKAGLILMHLRGTFETMHKVPPVENILREVSGGFCWSIEKAQTYGVSDEQIVLDIGIGFGKTLEQNLELIAKLDKICEEFSNYPMLVGTSRKSFIGKILNGASADERLNGSLASAAIAAWNGAKILRVHDVKATVEALKIVQAVKENL